MLRVVMVITCLLFIYLFKPRSNPLHCLPMEEKDDLASFRDSLFQEADVIASKRGAPEEEHTRTAMDTGQELTTEAEERLKREYLL